MSMPPSLYISGDIYNCVSFCTLSSNTTGSKNVGFPVETCGGVVDLLAEDDVKMSFVESAKNSDGGNASGLSW